VPISDDIKLGHAERLLAQLRESYLQDLPNHCGEIENLVLSFDRKDPETVFDEIFRHVHSIKGSAGTHGLHLISGICHHFEDHLKTLDGRFEKIDGRFINVCLAYIDCIRTAVSLFEKGGETLPLENELEQLRKRFLKNNLAGLLVSSSNYITMLCQQTMGDLPVKLTTVDDGFAALERLLQQKYDFIITDKELKQLNGVALTLAVRASDSVNRDTNIIMLTSKMSIDFPAGLAPDEILPKNTGLSHALVDAVGKIFNGK